MDKTYFLITSYTGGPFSTEKANHLIKYLKQIKKYYPNSYIVLIDSIPNEEIAKLCDLYICELLNKDDNHYAQGDLDKINIGLNLLEWLGAKYVIKTAYDYWVDDTIFEQQKQWIKLLESGIKIIGSQWGDVKHNVTFPNSISVGHGCYDIQAAKYLFTIDTVPTEPIFEQKVYSRLVKIFEPSDYYIYPSNNEMFNSEIYDIFNYAGQVVDTDKLLSIL
jgi:hypothetical protein